MYLNNTNFFSSSFNFKNFKHGPRTSAFLKNPLILGLNEPSKEKEKSTSTTLDLNNISSRSVVGRSVSFEPSTDLLSVHSQLSSSQAILEASDGSLSIDDQITQLQAASTELQNSSSYNSSLQLQAADNLLQEAIADLQSVGDSLVVPGGDTTTLNGLLADADTSLSDLSGDLDEVLTTAVGSGPSGPVDVTEGSEILVSSHSNQDVDDANVVGLKDGGHVVVYQHEDSVGRGIRMQRYDADGNAVGNETIVNTEETKHQDDPVVTALDDGGFVVAYETQSTGGDHTDIMAQRFDADGNAVGSEFRVNSTTDKDQEEVSLTSLSDGGFVAVYRSEDEFLAQRYDSDGNAVGGELQVASFSTQNEQHMEVTALDNGGFAVVLEEGGGSASIQANVFDADGNSVTGLFQVGTGAGADEDSSSSITTLEDGSFVIAHVDGSGQVHTQRFDEDGQALTGDTIVATGAVAGGEISIAGLDDGSYAIAYAKGSNVVGMRFDNENNVHTEEFQINDEAVDDDGMRIAATREGFVVTLVSEETGKQRITQKRFTFDGPVNTLSENARDIEVAFDVATQELQAWDGSGDAETQTQTTFTRLNNMIGSLNELEVTDPELRDQLVSELETIRDSMQSHVVDYGSLDTDRDLAKVADKIETVRETIVDFAKSETLISEGQQDRRQVSPYSGDSQSDSLDLSDQAASLLQVSKAVGDLTSIDKMESIKLEADKEQIEKRELERAKSRRQEERLEEKREKERLEKERRAEAQKELTSSDGLIAHHMTISNFDSDPIEIAEREPITIDVNKLKDMIMNAGTINVGVQKSAKSLRSKISTNEKRAADAKAASDSQKNQGMLEAAYKNNGKASKARSDRARVQIVRHVEKKMLDEAAKAEQLVPKEEVSASAPTQQSINEEPASSGQQGSASQGPKKKNNVPQGNAYGYWKNQAPYGSPGKTSVFSKLGIDD